MKKFGQDFESLDRELKILNEAYHQIINELDFDKVNNPFRILGFAVTDNLLKSLAAGTFSIGVAVLSKTLSKTLSTTTPIEPT